MGIDIAIKQKLFQLAEIVHLRVFGCVMSDEMRKFLGNLSWSFFGGIIAAGIMFAVNILAGRWLGPEEYGRYSAIFSFATILSALYLFGMDTSSVRYLADKQFAHSSKRIFTTSFLTVLFMQVVFTLLLLVCYKFFPKIIPISASFFWIGIFLAVIIALKGLFNGFLRAFHKYKQQSICRIVDAGMVFLVFFFTVFLLNLQDASSYAYSVIIGGSIFLVFSIWILRNQFSVFDLKLLKKIFSEYNQHVLLLSFISVVLISDKLIIGKSLGLKELGYFSAYYVSSHIFVAEIGGIFMNAFWPSVIKNVESLSGIIQKTTKIFIFYSPLWILLISLNTFILFSFFGKAYPLRYDDLFLFSVNAFLGIIFFIFMSFLNIHFIRRAILIFFVFVFSSIFILIFTKSIIFYLCAQIILQIGLIYYMRLFILKNNYGKI